MTKEDISVLKKLINNYSIDEVIHNLSIIASFQADELSDMGLKERAINLANVSDHLIDCPRSEF